MEKFINTELLWSTFTTANGSGSFISTKEKRKKSIIINFLNFKSVFEKQEICYNTYKSFL